MQANNQMTGLGLRKFGKNINMTIIRQLIVAILGLGTSVLLARILGPDGKGIFSMVILLPTLIVTFSNLGISPASVYYLARKDFSLVYVVRGNIFLGLGISGAAIIVSIIMVSFCSGILFPGIPQGLLFLGIILIPLSILQSYLISIFQGVQNFRIYNILCYIPQGVTLVIASIGLLAFKPEVWVAILANILGVSTGLIISIINLKQYLFSKIKGTALYMKKSIGYGWKAHLSNILAFLNHRVDMFLINSFLNPTSVGLYSISVSVAERLWMLSQSVSVVLLPRVSELKDDEDSRRKITPLISRWTLLVTVLIAVILAVISPWIIKIIFGEEFRESAFALQILLPGIVTGSISRVIANDISARGKPEINMYTSLFTVAINIFFNIILIPEMGINGAALATSVSYSLGAIAKLIIYSKLTGVLWYKAIIPAKTDFNLLIDLVKSKIEFKHRKKDK
jgi:O-antigen/teichoic acid export membrane protein